MSVHVDDRMRCVTLVPQPRRAVWSKAGQVGEWATRQKKKKLMRTSRQMKLSKTKNTTQRVEHNHTKTCISAMLLFSALHVVPEADDFVTVRVPVV
jgi:hypothetical protein